MRSASQGKIFLASSSAYSVGVMLFVILVGRLPFLESWRHLSQDLGIRPYKAPAVR